MANFKELNLEQSSQEWLEVRKRHITATEVAHIMSGQDSIFSVVQSKRGVGIQKDISNYPPVKEGKLKEPKIRGLIEQKFPQLLSDDELFLPQPCCESLDEPYFMASLDGYSKKADLIVEIKNVFSRYDKNWDELLQKGLNAPIPKKYGYYYQVQWQLMVTKAKAAMIVFHHSNDATEVSTENIRIFPIKPNLKVQEELKKIALKVKEIMLNNLPVEPEQGDKVQVTEQTLPSEVSQLIDAYRNTENTYKELSANLDVLKKERQKVVNRLGQLLLTDNQTSVFTDDWMVTRSMRKGTVNWDGMIRDGVITEEILEKYRSSGSPYTRLTLKEVQ